MQMEMNLNQDIAKMFKNDSYQDLTGVHAKLADMMIRQAIVESASKLKGRLERLESCYDTTGLEPDGNMKTLNKHMNIVIHKAV
jgi:hypothetical protein